MKEKNANLLEQSLTFSGKIFFELDGYVFKARGANGWINKGKIFYKDIRDIELRNTFGCIPNGLLIRTDDGQEYRYVLHNRKQIRTYLIEQKNRYYNVEKEK